MKITVYIRKQDEKLYIWARKELRGEISALFVRHLEREVQKALTIPEAKGTTARRGAARIGTFGCGKAGQG